MRKECSEILWRRNRRVPKKVYTHDSNTVVTRIQLYLIWIANHCTITVALTASPKMVLSSSLVW